MNEYGALHTNKKIRYFKPQKHLFRNSSNFLFNSNLIKIKLHFLYYKKSKNSAINSLKNYTVTSAGFGGALSSAVYSHYSFDAMPLSAILVGARALYTLMNAKRKQANIFIFYLFLLQPSENINPGHFLLLNKEYFRAYIVIKIALAQGWIFN
jgi:hypothetical protein